MTEFGSYEVLETVAVGSTGTVYRARHRDFGRIAAIKELSEQLRAAPGLLQRFRSEAQMLAALDDEHVVAVYDFVEEGNRAWIAEEWVDGVTIAALLTANGRLTAEQSLGVLRGALLGLAHAHDRNLVHRDFSPSNILADQAGTSKLVDFGLAAPVGGTGSCGTPAYMSPEAVRGEPVGKSSDVYSAAAVLFSLLSGRVPFPARSAADAMRAQVEQRPPALSGHGPAMADLVADAMSKDQATRPPDARAFLARLEDAARQRYGTDWLDRASIAGLVTAAGTGAAVVAAGSTAGAAASSGSSTATVFIDAKAATGAVTTAGKGASRFSRKWIVAGAAIAAAAVAIPIVAVALSADSTKKPADHHLVAAGGTETGPGQIATSPSISTPPPPTLSQLAPNGKYRIRVTITSTNIKGETVGPGKANVWTIKLTCTAGSCSGSSKSTSGKTFKLSFDGTLLTANYAKTFTGPCVYLDGAQKGQQQPGTLAAVSVTTAFRATVATRSAGPSPAEGVPLTFSGSGRGTETSKILKVPAGETCTPDPIGRDTSTVTLERIG